MVKILFISLLICMLAFYGVYCVHEMEIDGLKKEPPSRVKTEIVPFSDAVGGASASSSNPAQASSSSLAAPSNALIVPPRTHVNSVLENASEAFVKESLRSTKEEMKSTGQELGMDTSKWEKQQRMDSSGKRLERSSTWERLMKARNKISENKAIKMLYKIADPVSNLAMGNYGAAALGVAKLFVPKELEEDREDFMTVMVGLNNEMKEQDKELNEELEQAVHRLETTQSKSLYFQRVYLPLKELQYFYDLALESKSMEAHGTFREQCMSDNKNIAFKALQNALELISASGLFKDLCFLDNILKQNHKKTVLIKMVKSIKIHIFQLYYMALLCADLAGPDEIMTKAIKSTKKAVLTKLANRIAQSIGEQKPEALMEPIKDLIDKFFHHPNTGAKIKINDEAQLELLAQAIQAEAQEISLGPYKYQVLVSTSLCSWQTNPTTSPIMLDPEHFALLHHRGLVVVLARVGLFHTRPNERMDSSTGDAFLNHSPADSFAEDFNKEMSKVTNTKLLLEFAQKSSKRSGVMLSAVAHELGKESKCKVKVATELGGAVDYAHERYEVSNQGRLALVFFLFPEMFYFKASLMWLLTPQLNSEFINIRAKMVPPARGFNINLLDKDGAIAVRFTYFHRMKNEVKNDGEKEGKVMFPKRTGLEGEASGSIAKKRKSLGGIVIEQPNAKRPESSKGTDDDVFPGPHFAHAQVEYIAPVADSDNKMLIREGITIGKFKQNKDGGELISEKEAFHLSFELLPGNRDFVIRVQGEVVGRKFSKIESQIVKLVISGHLRLEHAEHKYGIREEHTKQLYPVKKAASTPED